MSAHVYRSYMSGSLINHRWNDTDIYMPEMYDHVFIYHYKIQMMCIMFGDFWYSSKSKAVAQRLSLKTTKDMCDPL